MIQENSIVTWTGTPAELFQRLLSVVAYLGKAMREADETGWPNDEVEAVGNILTDITHAAEKLLTANPKTPVTIEPFYERRRGVGCVAAGSADRAAYGARRHGPRRHTD